MNLREFLESYRSATLDLIEKIKNDEEYNSLLEKRQDLIRNIEKLSFSKDEFRQIASELDILKLEELLQRTMAHEKVELKKKINNIKITREARAKYENAQFRPTFFNKTI